MRVFFSFSQEGSGACQHPDISVTKAIAGLQIRALLQLLGCLIKLLIIDLTVCILNLLGGQLPVFGL